MAFDVVVYIYVYIWWRHPTIASSSSHRSSSSPRSTTRRAPTATMDGTTDVVECGDVRFDAASGDVDDACCAVFAVDATSVGEARVVAFAHRSRRAPRCVRVVRFHGDRTTTRRTTCVTVMCDADVTCVGVGGDWMVVVGDARGYAYARDVRADDFDDWDLDGDDDRRAMAMASTTSSSVTHKMRFASCGGVHFVDDKYVVTDAHVSEWDVARGVATRRWTLPRLAPLAAATIVHDSIIIAVGGAAVASASIDADANRASRARAAGRLVAKAASTAFGVILSAFNQNAKLPADAVVYEGEDMDDVPTAERPRWNCAFVDAPRRYSRFVSRGARFATTDSLHRCVSFQSLGDKIRVKKIIKGARDATIAYGRDMSDTEHQHSHPILYVYKPAVRALEAHRARGVAAPAARDVPDDPIAGVPIRICPTRATDPFMLYISSSSDSKSDAVATYTLRPIAFSSFVARSP